MARRYCVWWLHSRSREPQMSGLETGSLGPRTGSFLILFGHSVIVYLKPWCLSNGWKCMHDTIHCMTYLTTTWYGKIASWNLRLLQKTMMSWSVVSNSPLHSLHRSLQYNNISELPDNVFGNLTSLQWLWVHACMHDGVLYYFMHWAITSKMSFVRILVDQTTLNWWALLIAQV